MKELFIYGASDDLIEIEGIEGGGEFDTCSDNDPPKTFRIESKEGRIRLHCIYDGCWCFALGMVDEDDDIPRWHIVINYEGYTQEMTITVPNDAKIIKEW